MSSFCNRICRLTGRVVAGRRVKNFYGFGQHVRSRVVKTKGSTAVAANHHTVGISKNFEPLNDG